MHTFVSAALPQVVQSISINAELIYLTLGNKFMVFSSKLAKLSISFTSGVAQMIWCSVMPELSVQVIFGIDWLTQINQKIYWSKITIE